MCVCENMTTKIRWFTVNLLQLTVQGPIVKLLMDTLLTAYIIHNGCLLYSLSCPCSSESIYCFFSAILLSALLEIMNFVSFFLGNFLGDGSKVFTMFYGVSIQCPHFTPLSTALHVSSHRRWLTNDSADNDPTFPVPREGIPIAWNQTR